MEMAMIQAMQQQAAVTQQGGVQAQDSKGNVFETMVREMMGGEMPVPGTALTAEAELITEKDEEPGVEQQSMMAALAAQAQPVFVENEAQAVQETRLSAQAVLAAETPQQAAQAEQAAGTEQKQVQQDVQAPAAETIQQTVREIPAEEAAPQAQQQEHTAEDHSEPMQFTEIDIREEQRRVAEEAPLFAIPLEAAPVKVAEPVVELESPEAPRAMAQQIVKGAEQMGDETQSVLTIQVEPATLGPVKVIFSKNNGVLQVAIEASNPKAAALLEKHNPQLQSLLNVSLKGEVQVVVQRNEIPWLQPDSWNGNQQGGQQQRQQQERRQESKEAMDDFLHRLRLGLVSIEGVAS